MRDACHAVIQITAKQATVNKAMSIFRVMVLCTTSLLMASVVAQDHDNGDTRKEWTVGFESDRFLEMGDVVITQKDIDAYLQRIPAERRADVLLGADRIGDILTNMVLIEGFRPLAIAEGLLDDPDMQARLYLVLGREVRDFYREWYLDSIELDDYSGRARELYLTEPERFQTPQTIDFGHILVAAGSQRSEIEAMERVIEIHKALTEGVDFSEIAIEYSDDPSVTDNLGFFEGIDPANLVSQVAALLARTNQGELSPPVRSQFGWHLVVLEAVHPGKPESWEDARERAERIARERHRTAAYERLLRDIQDVPHEFADGAVAALLARYGIVPAEDVSEGEVGRTMIDD